jgi:hypothetical protein
MQLHTLSPKRAIVVALIACGAALIPAVALAAPSSPAAAATAARASASVTSIPSISVNSVTLVANGAAIQVTVTVTCGAGDDGTVNATTTQAVGLRIAQGGSSNGFTCTGKPQRESGLAAANVSGAPFRLGVALLQAGVADCPGANCTSASVNKVLSIGS